MMAKYWILFFFIIPFSSLAHPNIDKIPLEDRQKLEMFFDYLIHNSLIGYSLCGDKPISIETFPNLSKIPAKYAIKIFSKHPGYSILWRGWLIWQSYSHLFPSNRFVLRFIPKYSTLVLINKKSTRSVIEENLDLFQKYSNSNQTADEFLEEICCPKNKEYVVCYNSILLGILLGYGRNNAIAFSKRNYIQKLEPFRLYDHDDLNAFMNPGFIAINNGTNEEENKQIRQILQTAKNNIQIAFKNGNFFRTFIDLFSQ
jgi:hypothetical protein